MELLLLLLQLGLIVVIVAAWRNPAVSPHLPTLLLFMILMWFTTPVVLTVIFQGHLKTYSYVNYDLFLFYAVLESATLLITLLFLLSPKPYFKFLVESRLTEIHLNSKGALLGVGIALGFTFLSAALAAIYMGSSYFEQNAFFFLSEGSDTYNNLGSIAFIQTILSCFCCACFVHVWPREKQARWLLVGLVLWALITVGLQAPSGARIAMLQPFFLLVLYCQAQPWSPRQKVSLVGFGAVGTIVVGSILSVAIGQARYGDRLKLDDILSSSSKAADQNIVSEMAVNMITKFDSFSTGAILVERMGAGRAGVQPYIGALLAMIPRAVLPSKPTPGSFDGTIRGYPTRVVAVQMGMSEEAGNVNISPASITVWHFGFVAGLLLMVVANVLNLYLVNSLLLAPSVFFKSLAFFLIGLPALTAFYAPPDILLMNIERISLVVLAMFVIHYVLERRLQQRESWQRTNAYQEQGMGEV